MRALLLGSIGVLAETSDIQRQAFNQAFEEAGLSWHWDKETYAAMLTSSGGKDRIETFAAERGETVDAERLHARKSEIFQQALDDGISPRPGVLETMDDARNRGWSIAFVTTTSHENVDAILSATGIGREQFDLVLDASQVERGKPDPQAYQEALHALDLGQNEAIAVEDNPDGVAAANAAGLTCIATPGALHSKSQFYHAAHVQNVLRLPSV